MTAMTGKRNKSRLRVFIMVSSASLRSVANSLRYQSALRNLVTNILECQLAQPAAGKYFNVGHVRNRPRRLRKAVKLFVGFKTDLSQHQAEQVPKKHIDCKLAGFEWKRVAVLTNLVRFED